MSAPTESESAAGEATPRPWAVVPTPNSKFGAKWVEIRAGRIPVVQALSFERSRDDETWTECGVGISEANSDLIVRSVNAHDALRALAVEAIDTDADVVQALKAWFEGDEKVLWEDMVALIRRVEARIAERRAVLEGVSK